MTPTVRPSAAGWALSATLQVAVPMWIARLAEQPDGAREQLCQRWAAAAVDPLASQADLLVYGAAKTPTKADRREIAELFNHLARALAAGAHLPGGVTFAGMHWCTDHAACEPAERRPFTIGEQLHLFAVATRRRVETATVAGGVL